ncbi:MAG: aryl-sulfate sulfotransferase [Candidatus Neomarinimicrobiota bacterium]
MKNFPVLYKAYSFILLLATSLCGQQTVGLIINEPGTFSGYTLFAPNSSILTYLINNDGLLVHKWKSDFVPGTTAYLLEDGSLLRSAAIESDTGNRTGGFQLFDWDNNLLWEYYAGNQHHDIAALPNGNVLLLINDEQTHAEAVEAGRNPALLTSTITSLSIQEIKQTGLYSGEIIWEWQAWDHLIQNYDSTGINYGIINEHPELIDINFSWDKGTDWLHPNSVDYHPGFDQIIISNRNSNEFWIIDHSTTTSEAASHTNGNRGKGGDLLYRWGNSTSYGSGTAQDQKLYGQHDVHWIKPGLEGAGNILLFNNGLGRPGFPYSSINEIIPPVDEQGNYFIAPDSSFGPPNQSWIYTALDTISFLSPRFGGVQRLPNGNTLICNSGTGTFFEITENLDIVWKYINPVTREGVLVQGEAAEKNTVARCYRYASDYPGLIGNLTPLGPIEILGLENVPEKIHHYKLLPNYPNPFNPNTTINYTLPKRTQLRIVVYNLLGREITELENITKDAGTYSINWNGLDQAGRPAGAGLYFYQLKAGQFTKTRKMLLLR